LVVSINIRADFTEMAWEIVDRIKVAVVNRVMNILVP
jgi:hypothetical protein